MSSGDKQLSSTLRVIQIKFSQWCLKNKHSKYFLQQIIKATKYLRSEKNRRSRPISRKCHKFKLALMSIRTYSSQRMACLIPKESIRSQAIALAKIHSWSLFFPQLQHNDLEDCGASSHKLALRQLLLSLLPDKCGSLGYSRAFQTFP